MYESSPETPETDPPEAPHAQSTKKGVFERFKKPIIAATGITLAATSALGIREVVENSSGSEQPNTEPSPTQTIDKPPSTDSQLTEITPKPLQETPAPIAQTPTPTPNTSETTPIPAVVSPETKKPQNGNWYFAPKAENVTEENYQNAVNTIKSVEEKFPKIGNIEIKIVPGLSSTMNTPGNAEGTAVLVYGDQLFGPTNAYNEFSGYFNPRINRAILQKYYSPEQLAAWDSYNEQILSEYMDLSPQNMFSEKMLHSSPYSQVTYIGFSLYVGQSIAYPGPEGVKGYPLDKPIFADYIDTEILGQLASRHEGEPLNVSNWADFAAKYPQIIEVIAGANNFNRTTIEWLNANAENLKYWQWLGGTGVRFNSKTLGDYIQSVIPVMQNYAATEMTRNSNPEILSLAGDDASRINQELSKLLEAVGNEITTRALNMEIQGVIQNYAAQQLYEIIWQDYR